MVPRDRTAGIVVVDQQPLVAEALALIAERSTVFCVVAHVTEPALALDAARRTKAELVVSELVFSGRRTLAIVDDFGAANAAAVAFLTACTDPVAVEAALRCGAVGVLAKTAPVDELCTALRKIAGGTRVVSDNLRTGLYEQLAANSSGHLSDREVDVLRLVAKGKKLPAVGAALSVSTATARTYLRRAYVKLGVDTRSEAIVAATRQGLIE